VRELNKRDFDGEKEQIDAEKRRNDAIEAEVIRVRERQTFLQKIELIKKKKTLDGI